jgi:hypothetical protein
MLPHMHGATAHAAAETDYVVATVQPGLDQAGRLLFRTAGDELREIGDDEDAH